MEWPGNTPISGAGLPTKKPGAQPGFFVGAYCIRDAGCGTAGKQPNPAHLSEKVSVRAVPVKCYRFILNSENQKPIWLYMTLTVPLPVPYQIMGSAILRRIAMCAYVLY